MTTDKPRLYPVQPKESTIDRIVNWIEENRFVLGIFVVGLLFGIFWTVVWMVTPPLESGLWYNHR